MPRPDVALLTAIALSVSMHAQVASAQRLAPGVSLVSTEAAMSGGRVHGLVRDEAGRAVADVSIVALGSSPLPVIARSDAAGQFALTLPPGNYILRASRDGYVSTYREPVQIQNSTLIERTITIIRAAAADAKVLLASTGGDFGIESLPQPSSIDAGVADHGHDETAWRLRHLPPSALRDIGETDASGSANSSGNFSTSRVSPQQWLVAGSARTATSFFANTNFNSEVNFLTTSTWTTSNGLPIDAPKGVAYAAVGAPVGSLGDWIVRGATTTLLSSWAVLGEYHARDNQPHAFSAGVSYSAQSSESGNSAAPTAINDRVRSVGAMYGSDRWHATRQLEVDYGLRFDRYDYVAGSEFVSPRIGARLAVMPATSLTVQASEDAIAPGANEFMPPATASPWLPPERTFSTLLADGTFRAERVRSFDVGLEHVWGGGDGPALSVHRFREVTTDQIATIFGLDQASDVGHYNVATPGDVDVSGWGVHVEGRIANRIRGGVDYSTSRATWTSGADAAEIAVVAPSAVRLGQERLHDITTSIETSIPETSTHIAIACRFDSTFSQAVAATNTPAFNGRFDVEVRQDLPFHPTRSSKTVLLIVVRNLYRDLGQTGSVYDELLTVAPPMRVMGGVQVRF